jgi:hypothetical protein
MFLGGESHRNRKAIETQYLYSTDVIALNLSAMKNLRVALLLLMIPFVFLGCKKDKPERLLTAKPWRLCGYEFIPGITIAGYYYTDYYTPYVDSDCIYDELIEFTDDGRIITREGSVVCIGAEQPSKMTGVGILMMTRVFFM